jgi:opacity protein-like surface antigen
MPAITKFVWMPKFVLIIFLLLLSYNLKAQTWEFGGGVGAAGYMGDLNINDPIKPSGPSFGIFAKYNFDGYLGLRISYNFGIIAAADSNSSSPQFRQRNLSFTTTLNEVSVVAEFNFMRYIPSVTNSKYTPYLYLGAALVNYNPTTVFNGQKYDLRQIATEGEKKPYPTTAIAIPYGAGFRYNVSSSVTLGVEIGYRNPNTDYLDDVSGNYVFAGHNTLQEQLSDRSGEKTGVYIGSPGSQRGDGSSRDTYFFTQFTISYTFISRKCYFSN